MAAQGTRRIPVTSLSDHRRTEEHPLNGLYALKPWYTRRLTVLVDAAVSRETSPDVFTGLGVLAALLAALSTWRGWWLVAGVLLAARLAGANLDGAVARARGVSRPWGFVLNEIGDRTSDLLMYAGLAALAARVTGGWATASVAWVLLAAAAAFLPTFASLAGAAAGAARRNGGPLGKTERCALTVLATAVPSWIPWICAVMVLGSVLTCALRLRGAHRDLAASDVAGAR